MSFSYVVVCDHITRQGVRHRSFYGPFSWSQAAAYSDYLEDRYAGDACFRIDGEPAVTMVSVDTMHLPNQPFMRQLVPMDAAVHDGLGVGGRPEELDA